jgi:hypothetical protein
MAHPCSGQSWRRARIALGVVGVLSFVSCQSTQVPDSIWPPPDFLLRFEELRAVDTTQQVVRRFWVRADGLVVYATSSAWIEDGESSTRLPIYDRLAVYRLVPECTRALARRLDRYGLLELDELQGERGAAEDFGVALHWHAFGVTKKLESRGPVHGAMADILATIAAHFPDGESIGIPGVAERGVANVLRGVPTPQVDAAGALAAFQGQLAETPDDVGMLLDAFTLASHLGRRDLAMELLQQWKAVTQDERRMRAFQDDGEPKLTPAILERMLPRS